eukprot:3654494-Ditylum_brightwellii.AAC.1
MKHALQGLLPDGFEVMRIGPYENGSYTWTISLPKGTSLNGEAMHVVKHGGGAVKLRGTNASVTAKLTRLGSKKLGGYFRLKLITGNEKAEEKTRII